MSKSSWPVNLDSIPSGTTVTLTDKNGTELLRNVRTPTTVILDASAGYFQRAHYTFVFEKEGYSSTSNSISARLNPWFYGNIGFVGLGSIGFLIVDPATGAMWKLDEAVTGRLSPLAQPNALPARTTGEPSRPGRATVGDEFKAN